MSKVRSVNKDWEFVSKGTEISLGKFVAEYFTPLTLDLQTGLVSTEDTRGDLGGDKGGSDGEGSRGGRLDQRGQTRPWLTKRRWKSLSDSVDRRLGDKQKNEEDYSS
jgi:hypothetical protein